MRGFGRKGVVALRKRIAPVIGAAPVFDVQGWRRDSLNHPDRGRRPVVALAFCAGYLVRPAAPGRYSDRPDRPVGTAVAGLNDFRQSQRQDDRPRSGRKMAAFCWRLGSPRQNRFSDKGPSTTPHGRLLFSFAVDPHRRDRIWMVSDRRQIFSLDRSFRQWWDVGATIAGKKNDIFTRLDEMHISLWAMTTRRQ